MKASTGRSPVSFCVRWVPVVMLLGFLFAGNTSARADAITITSPDRPQTFTYGEVIWHQLYERPGGELGVRTTVSNLPYVGDGTPRTDEPFDFRFPGARLDSARGIFFARSGHGEMIPVGASGNSHRAGLICRRAQKCTS